jgi:glutamate racemase
MIMAAGNSPIIGVFDSGVGGLTVARAVLNALPQARLRYLADTAHVPYGPRSLAQVRDFALQIIAFLFEQGADAVVMGCNMSSAAGAHEAARQRFPKPVFEVIDPGSRAACAASGCGRIGVIATLGTVTSGAYGRVLHRHGAPEVFEQACPRFVPLVEGGASDGPEVEAAVAEYLRPLREAAVDTLIFGCTHYPFLRAPIARFMGEGVTLIDPAEFAARELAAVFGPAISGADDPARHRFYSSGDPESLRREGERFLGLPLVHVEHVDVPVETADCLEP